MDKRNDAGNKHPEREEVQTKIAVEDMLEFIGRIDSEIRDIVNRRSVWEERQVRWYKERYGIRGKKNFPFPGCSNMHIPVIDMQIKKLLPAYVNLLWGSSSVAEFRVLPNGGRDEALRKQATYNSHILNHLIKDRMDKSFEKTVMWTDRMLMSGFCVIKVTYDYKSELKIYTFSVNDDLSENEKIVLNDVLKRKDVNGYADVKRLLTSVFRKKGADIDEDDAKHNAALDKATKSILRGKKKTRINIDEVIEHYPKWTVVKPQDFIIDTAYNDLQEAPLVCHRMYYSPAQLKQMASNGLFGKDGEAVVDEIIASFGAAENNSSYDQAAKTLSGAEKNADNGLIEIREVHCLAPVDKTGVYRRCTLYYSPAFPEKALKFVQLPYEDNKIPFVKVALEIKDDGFYSSRGIPAMLDYLATMVNVRHNQRVDNLTIANSPMIKYIPGQVTMSNVRYIPGQGIPVKDMNAISPVVLNPGNTSAFMEEERLLRNYIENYVASPDFTLDDSYANGSQPRKATEVLQIASQRKDVFSVDSKIYLSAIRELLEMTWSRWIQYGSEAYEIEVKGEANPVHWERRNGQPLKIYPKGTLQDINPLVRAQKARQWLSVLSDPFVGKYYNAAEIAEYIASSIDNEKAERFLVDDETVAAKESSAKKGLMEQQMERIRKLAELEDKKQKSKIDEIILKEQLKKESDLAKITLKASTEDSLNKNQIREKAKADIARNMAKA